jgi:hypothetical protein
MTNSPPWIRTMRRSCLRASQAVLLSTSPYSPLLEPPTNFMRADKGHQDNVQRGPTLHHLADYHAKGVERSNANWRHSSASLSILIGTRRYTWWGHSNTEAELRSDIPMHLNSRLSRLANCCSTRQEPLRHQEPQSASSSSFS